MGPIPILEMARAYGLRPRLWLLIACNVYVKKKMAGLRCQVSMSLQWIFTKLCIFTKCDKIN